MVNWKRDFRKLTENSRSSGQQARVAAAEIPNLLARGHMHGVSDGLDVAAEDVDRLLDKPDTPADASKATN